MCKYCKNIKTGDDYNPLLTGNVDLGFAGKLMLDAVLVKYKYGDGAALGLFGCIDCNNSEIEKYLRVYYCPICGEKL